jgi:alpha-beta hydrolase superfamily lysophospholipase
MTRVIRQKVTFTNSDNLRLDGMLESPETPPKAYALFAHCFTCSKTSVAASRIGRALAQRGVAVLRFDFTGLGGSEGDFANTNFSSNIEDLVAAANFLKQEYKAPTILIGHSLGGAAVLACADQVPSAKAVVTVGAPSDPAHVAHLFAAHRDEIEDCGCALVNLSGRQFTIKQQFIEDIEEQRLDEKIRKLKKALLIMHSPVDDTVEIDEAAHIYQAAMHPKSFVSLDDADHLITKKEDAEYVAETIGAWVTRYLRDEDISVSSAAA